MYSPPVKCNICGAAVPEWLAYVCSRCATEASITSELVEHMGVDDLLPPDVHEGGSFTPDTQDDWRAQVMSERPKLNVAVRPERGFRVFDKMGGSSWHNRIRRDHGLQRAS